MEAFPAIFLATNDEVLAESIPGQIQHALGETCRLLESAEAVETAIPYSPPDILVADLALPGLTLLFIEQLRHNHPLLGIIAVEKKQGDKNAATTRFSAMPLAVVLERPLSMPALIRSMEQLSCDRRLTAGNQKLPLNGHLFFSPAEKCLTTRDATSQTELTDKETGMLLCLYHHRMAGLTRRQLLEQVWGYGDGMDTHTLETHLYRLRQKLREISGDDRMIETSHGTYRLKIS